MNQGSLVRPHSKRELRVAGSRFPLTAAQRSWWHRINTHHGGMSTKSVCFATRIVGWLDVELLRTCMDELMCRHEVLRASIELVDGAPVQIIEAPSHCELIVLDIESSAADVQSALRFGEPLVTQEVNLLAGRLFAAQLLRLSPHEHVLLVAQEHIISDAFSSAILHRELWSMYRQGARGLAPALPELPLSFTEYALWQQRTFDAWVQEHGEHWTRRLAAASPIKLPFEGRSAESALHHRMVKLPLGVARSESLRELARRKQTLPSVIVLTVYAAALARWCNQSDLLIRFISHSRHRPELLTIVGPLASDLYLRIAVCEAASLADLLDVVSRELRSAYAHHDMHRVSMLVPECSSEAAFNWTPAATSQVAETDDGVTVEPLAWEIPWSGPYCAQFREGPEGIVAQVYCAQEASAWEATLRFGDLLRLFADAFLQAPSERIETVR